MTDTRIHLASTDALPYYDNEIDRVGMRAKVEREIAAETKARAGTDAQSEIESRLPPVYSPFADRPDLERRMNEIGLSQKTDALDRTRYQLNAPSDDGDDGNAWNAALRNAEAQLGHSDVRLSNVDLMKKLGANQWRLHNFQQEAFLRAFEQASQAIQEQTNSLNRTRKASQAQTGQELTRLSTRWAELLNRCLSVELANVIAQGEIEEAEATLLQLQRRVDEAK